MKMEKTECSETSAYTIQTPGDYSEKKHATGFRVVTKQLFTFFEINPFLTVKISIMSSPREIKLTCRCSRDGSVFKVTRPGAGVQFLPCTSDVSPFQRGQTGSDAHPAPELTENGRRFSPRVRSPGVKTTTPRSVASNVADKNMRSYKPTPFTPSWPESECDGSYIFE